MDKESEYYQKLQEAKSDLESALEKIRNFNAELGSDDEETFESEVKPALDLMFPNWELI